MISCGRATHAQNDPKEQADRSSCSQNPHDKTVVAQCARKEQSVQWTPPSRHHCIECKRGTGYMQRNGAAPMFCFLLCFWRRGCGLTELIHKPGSASPPSVDRVRRHVMQRRVSSLHGVTHTVVRQSPLSFRPRGIPAPITSSYVTLHQRRSTTRWSKARPRPSMRMAMPCPHRGPPLR